MNLFNAKLGKRKLKNKFHFGGLKNGKIVSTDTKACLEHISIRTLNISSCFGYCKTMSDLYDRKKVKYDN